jgi:N-acetylglucosamine kinase-like BadF-type ATPase
MSKQLTTLALDAGQTGIRSLLISENQSLSKDFEGLRTDLELFPQLAKVINQIVDNHEQAINLAIGMTGLTESQSKPDLLLEQLRPQIVKVDLVHDSISGFLGAMSFNQGSVTAVGTGVVDGWGNLIGDAGSAYWIGRAALEAAMRSYDGRIEKSKLEKLLDNFSHPEEAYIELQTDANRVSVVASFAKEVIELAESDSTAREIIQRAGAELAQSAATAARRVGLLEQPSPRFSWAGNVMKAELLKDSFIEALVGLVPTASFHEPIAEPIFGVALIPTLPADSPLMSFVHTAERLT